VVHARCAGVERAVAVVSAELRPGRRRGRCRRRAQYRGRTQLVAMPPW
jgi:hypothetical protein